MHWLRLVQFIRLVILSFVALSLAVSTTDAEASSAAPDEQKSSSVAQMPTAATQIATVPDAAKQFANVLPILAKRGSRTHLPDHLATDLGLPNPPSDTVAASASSVGNRFRSARGVSVQGEIQRACTIKQVDRT